MKLSKSQQTSFEAYLKSKAFTRKSIKSTMAVIGLYWRWLEKENLEAAQVSYNDLLLYMKYNQRKGVSQRTIQNHIWVIKHFYNYLISEAHLLGRQVNTNPATDIAVKGVRKKVLYHILLPLELQAVYNGYKSETLTGRRNLVMLGLLVYQGLKTEELSRLEVNHIKLREGQIDVPGGRKSNHRMMKLEAHQVMDMYDYTLRVRPLLLEMEPKRKSQIRQATDRLFISEGGHSTHFSNLMTQLIKKVREFNKNIINAKQIRASVITKWLKQHNLREVQYLAGHRYISSTESYQENNLEGLQEEVQQFHPLG